MNGRASPAAALALALAAAAVWGCGSAKTTTVSVGETATPGAGEARTARTAPAARTPASSRPKSTHAGSSLVAHPRRTEPAPAFTREGASTEEGVGAALAVVRARGFTASDPSSYHSGQTLRVLIGARGGSQDGHEQQAFFFEDERYLGTDASQPSGAIHVVSQSDTEVTLAYSLYQPRDPLCCPKAGQASVRFQLDNGRLQALGAIPPVSSASAPSRR